MSPARAPDDSPAARAVAALLEEGVGAGAFSAASAHVSVVGVPTLAASAGAATRETLFDLASLTKPIAISSLAVRGLAEGWLDLDAPSAHPAGAGLPLRALLGHFSGLPAHDDLPAHLDAALGAWRPGAPETLTALERRLAAHAAAADPARGVVYSDLGYILLGWHFERALGRPLPELVASMTGFGGHYGGVTPPPDPHRYAPTGVCPRRGRRLYGEVNDRNAWALGGAAGHAGLFSTADAVGAWALDLWRAADGPAGEADPARRAAVRTLWDPASRPHTNDWVLGWMLPSPGASSAGTRVSPEAVGHLGYTGTSVWIDRRDALIVVLLTNRVDRGEAPGAEPGDPGEAVMKAFRPRFHDGVRDVLELP